MGLREELRLVEGSGKVLLCDGGGRLHWRRTEADVLIYGILRLSKDALRPICEFICLQENLCTVQRAYEL
jgi:hypothetical protein